MNSHGTQVEIVRSAAADSLLGDQSFLVEWQSLLSRCPWATAFQGPGFLRAWYQTYQPKYQPLLVLSRTVDGSLQGMLSLATSTHGTLVVAGTHHAEYQVWLSTPELANLFPARAVQVLRRLIPSSGLRFRYLPPGTPTDWTTAPPLNRMCLQKSQPRPLLRFGTGDEIDRSLNKSGTKSRLKRLQKMGRFEFTRVTDPEEFDGYFDSIIRCYDSRNLAVHETAPFHNDPLKKPFHRAMLRVPGLLHATVLKAGGHIASAQLNLWSGKEVHLGLIAHNPFLARHSPGKLHILLLAQMLRREGFEQLDLTPGGDPYKERFASAHDQVAELTVFAAPHEQRRGAMIGRATAAARNLLAKVDVTPRQALRIAGQVKHVRPAHLVRRVSAWVHSRQEIRIYRANRSAISLSPAFIAHDVRRDALDDVLAYQPGAVRPSRVEFASTALARIESDQHPYTIADDGRLLHAAWLALRPDVESLTGPLKRINLPADSALVFDVETFAPARDAQMAARSLPVMLRDALDDPGIRDVFVAVAAKNYAVIDLIEKTGFTYQRSVVQQTRFGRDPDAKHVAAAANGTPQVTPNDDPNAATSARRPSKQRAKEAQVVEQ